MTITVLLLTMLLAAVNGANDVAKGIATLAGAGVTRYRTAVLWGAATTLVGSLAALCFGEAMRQLFAFGIVDAEPTARFAVAVLFGAAGWVGLATVGRLPVSTTHALVGALLGACLLAAPRAVRWDSLLVSVAIPLLVSAVLAYLISTLLAWRTSADTVVTMRVMLLPPMPRLAALGRRVMTGLHWLSAGAVGAARGLNDTPKLAAIGGFVLVPAGMSEPEVILLIAVTMLAGSVVAGRRVARRLGEDVVPLTEAGGLGANLTTVLLVGAGAGNGLPMSTTHVSTGAIAGVAGGRTSRLNVRTLRDFAIAWTLTPLTAGAIAGMTYAVTGA